jgi:N-acyl-D-aspartate/D-glutamate deacylase
MLDLRISGGLVVDGSGQPAFTGDVGVRDGRIVAIGKIDEPARETIDADGLIVSPGFIDVHTHYDVQVFWDGTLSPSPLHGVTTVIGGNCGFSVAPLSPQDAEYLMRMLARVEGMPLEALEAGAAWDWRTTQEYLDALEGTLAPNAGFMVGHSALRRAVMHDDANAREATPDEIESMMSLLHQGLAAGGMGFSSTWSRSHNDHEGIPVPSRHATREEVVALCSVLRQHPGTQIEFLPGMSPFGDSEVEMMTEMSLAGGCPLNWNVLSVTRDNEEMVAHQLKSSDYAAQRGARVIALTLPDTLRTRLNFRSGFVLDILPGWDKLMALPPDEKLRMLADPERRAEMHRLAGPTPRLGAWEDYLLIETRSIEYERFVGQTFGEIGTQLGKSAWDALIDTVVADGLDTVISKRDTSQDDVSWRHRVDVWRDPRTLVGASDAGAHLDMVDSFGYTTTLLSRAVRERELMGWEEAIQLVTDAPARLYGMFDRGRIAEGFRADLAIFDPTTIAPQAPTTRTDLPAGAGRLYAGADGMQHVLVSGVPIVARGEFTDARPGSVLRSGRDTEPVGLTAAS